MLCIATKGATVTRPKIKTVDFLSRLALFDQLEPAELEQLALATTEVHAARGDVLFRRGDACTGFHIVLYGRVKLAFSSSQGNEKVVELVGPGASFGEAVMFASKPYIVTVTALEDSMLLHVAKEAILTELERTPGFALKLLAGLSRRLHALMGDVEGYSLNSGTQRVIGYLLKKPLEDGATVSLQATKMVVASRLNLTPEHFSRILHDLADQQLIKVQGKHIVILDVERLRQYDK